MEFQEFCKEYKRMCLSNECKDCPLNDLAHLTDTCEVSVIAYPQRAYDIIEQWAKEHPIVTNADKFKEVFGRTLVNFAITNLNEQGLTIYGLSNHEITEWMEQEYKEPKEGERIAQTH